jgi:hypothetical protein
MMRLRQNRITLCDCGILATLVFNYAGPLFAFTSLRLFHSLLHLFYRPIEIQT